MILPEHWAAFSVFLVLAAIRNPSLLQLTPSRLPVLPGNPGWHWDSFCTCFIRNSVLKRQRT